jgi:hypothetical protein
VTTDSDYQFSEQERPRFMGAPFVPAHPLERKLLYAAVGLYLGIGSTFANSLITTNVSILGGSMGLYLTELYWLPAVYVAMNATANLTLVKARIQFGIPRSMHWLLGVYACVGFLQILLPGFAMEVATRALCGICAGGMITLSIYYLMQIFEAKHRPLALVIGVSLPQIGIPLARLVPVDVLTANACLGLHFIEPAVALTALCLMIVAPLPPTERGRAFEPLDLLTVALSIVAMLLLCGVIGEGRYYWWTDAPFLGWILVASLPLFATIILVETHRSRPLLRLEFFKISDIARFVGVALLVRLALSEQTYGSVGLLTFSGLNNDQLHTLFALVVLAMFIGLILACVTLAADRIRLVASIAALIIAIGAFMDSDATNVTRPPQLYLSQSLLGLGTTLFIGPAMVFGMLHVLKKGQDYLVTYVVLFNITQNVGSFAASSVLGSYQIIQTHAHTASLTEHILAADPQVVDRIQSGARAVSGVIQDPALTNAEGAALLSQKLAGEANILAFNDVFRAVSYLAICASLYLLWRAIRTDYWARITSKERR